MKKVFRGFTLAEVLITLGVIGVVAAMTIPTLISNYQKRQYVTQLKKDYSLFQQGLKQYMATQGVTSLGDTDLYDGTTSIYVANTARQTSVDNIMKSLFKTIKTCKQGDDSCKIGYNYLEYSDPDPQYYFNNAYNFYTVDGTCYGVALATSCTPNYNRAGPMKALCGSIYIDINGTKKPNKIGRDLFLFYLGHDGTLFPDGGIASAMYIANSTDPAVYSGGCWQADSSLCGIPGSSVLTNTNASGNTCSARIMEEGWEMNY